MVREEGEGEGSAGALAHTPSTVHEEDHGKTSFAPVVHGGLHRSRYPYSGGPHSGVGGCALKEAAAH